jgi:Zn ribbon nucleic-acid-binding protein
MSFVEDFSDIAKRLNTLEKKPETKPEPAKPTLTDGSVCPQCKCNYLRRRSSPTDPIVVCTSCGFHAMSESAPRLRAGDVCLQCRASNLKSYFHHIKGREVVHCSCCGYDEGRP